MPVKTIYEWRQTAGSVGLRIGRHVKFRISDVQAWVDGQRDVPPGALIERACCHG